MANPALDRIVRDPDRTRDGSVVTLDSVVQRTATLLGILVIVASLTWFYAERLLAREDMDAFSTLAGASFVASLAALGLSFFISFRKNISPALVMIFAALEGLVIGFFSKMVTLQVGDNEPVVGAVIGTFVAFAATLFVYKFFNIQVSDRMRKIVMIGVFAFVGVALVDLALSFFGAAVGVNGFGPMGFIFSLIGVALAIFMLLVDFDAVEKAIEYQLPERESWRLAFGLTVTAVWLYVNLLRILAILRGGE